MMLSNRRDFLKLAGAGVAAPALIGLGRNSPAKPASGRPNIVFILADDIGYGDFGCYGATRVRTPNVDRVAKEGIRFTDAHSSASVCSPTRYSLVTGQYAWRNPSGDHILSGEDPLSIDTAATTVPSLLKRAGYTSAVVGKWHMGLGPGKGDQNWNGEIQPGPLEVGFDYAFFYPATNDRVPCVFVENHRVVGLDPRDPIAVSYAQKIGNEPTGRENPELLKLKLIPGGGHDNTIVDGISRIGFVTGGKSAWWKDEEIADTLAGKAVAFIERNQSRPFFLYLATHNIHVPIWPNRRFKGTSSCGTRCDSIQEFDGSVGKVLATLDRLKLTGNTLVIISSDNGGTMDDGYQTFDSRDANGHLCNGALHGYKGSLWEGGHREPFLARWPGRIKPGSQSDELLCLVDTLATCAAITGQKLPPDAGPDSFNMLPALLGEKRSKPLRDHLVMQINSGRQLAIRKGPWKLIPAAKGGQPRPKSGISDVPQLYNLATDLGETTNLAAQHPEIVKELSALLAQVRERGRSRPD
jgi:arylsulfatase A-like enzyme